MKRMTKIKLNSKSIELIRNNIENENEINELLNEAIEEFLQKDSEKALTKVDKWIEILDELIDWANKEIGEIK
jgi:hypothetical protein